MEWETLQRQINGIFVTRMLKLMLMPHESYGIWWIMHFYTDAHKKWNSHMHAMICLHFFSRIIIMSALYHGHKFRKSKYMSVSRSASDLRNVWNWSGTRWTRVHPFLWTRSGGIYWLILLFHRRSRLSHFLNMNCDTDAIWIAST